MWIGGVGHKAAAVPQCTYTPTAAVGESQRICPVKPGQTQHCCGFTLVSSTRTNICAKSHPLCSHGEEDGVVQLCSINIIVLRSTAWYF